MVRQDKIAYFTTFFEGEGWNVQFPKIDPLDSMINAVFSNCTACSVLLSIYHNFENVTVTSTSELKDTLQSAGLDYQNTKTIKSILKWTYQTFKDYSLHKLSNWSTEKIYHKLNEIHGINSYSISVMLSETLGRDVFPVDKEVYRVITRMGIVQKELLLNQVSDLINPYIPVGRDYYLFRNLKRFAQEICDAENPDCQLCELQNHCDFNNKKSCWVEK